MEYFTGSPEDAEPTAEELGLKSPIAKQVYGLSKKVRELQEQLREKDQRIAKLEERDMFLQCLEEAGVDNWEGYSEAHRILAEWKKELSDAR